MDEIWCLGDLVGYGAQPDECVELARETCDLCLAGNHDLVVTGDLDIADFSSSAAAAAIWTQENIGTEALAFLRGLSASLDGREIGLWHASPRDPVWEYVLSTWQADECMDLMEPRVGSVGHSHIALWFRRERRRSGQRRPGQGRLRAGSERGRVAAEPRWSGAATRW